MTDERIEDRAVVVWLPYELKVEDLHLEPSTEDKDHEFGLRWLLDNATHDEVVRILQGAVALYGAVGGTIGECLATAIVWERG